MKIILLSETGRQSHTVNLQNWRARIAALAIVAALLATGVVLGLLANESYESYQIEQTRTQFLAQREADQRKLEQTREQVANEINALTAKIASLQARIMRLDALGERVVQVAKLDKGEFDFSRQPAVGGPSLKGQGVDEQAPTVSAGRVYDLLEELGSIVENREHQLSVLDRQILAREMRSESFVTGRPVKWGWMSSPFGKRTDPFNGKEAWHAGVDFAGKAGSDVIAVASGVVTAAERRYGYGNMVEINHGNGIVTRYGHNQANLVSAGDIVEKGAPIAKMGSTGRSTGPHVHFEVLRHGKPIDPERYIYRASL